MAETKVCQIISRERTGQALDARMGNRLHTSLWASLKRWHHQNKKGWACLLYHSETLSRFIGPSWLHWYPTRALHQHKTLVGLCFVEELLTDVVYCLPLMKCVIENNLIIFSVMLIYIRYWQTLKVSCSTQPPFFQL